MPWSSGTIQLNQLTILRLTLKFFGMFDAILVKFHIGFLWCIQSFFFSVFCLFCFVLQNAQYPSIFVLVHSSTEAFLFRQLKNREITRERVGRKRDGIKNKRSNKTIYKYSCVKEIFHWFFGHFENDKF